MPYAPSETSSHAESISERLSVVQHELLSHRSRKGDRDRMSLEMCADALRVCTSEYHDLEERIALQASEHRSELGLVDSFVREALFRVEQRISNDSDTQFEFLTEQTAVVNEKVKQLERVVVAGEGVQTEEEQIGMIRNEMNATTEAARQLCEDEELCAKRDLADLVDPASLKIRNVSELANIESRGVDRVIEDTRAQLLALAAPAGGHRLEPKQREIAQALQELKRAMRDAQIEREQSFATLYGAMTDLSREVLRQKNGGDFDE